MSTDYTEFDAALIERIKNGCTTASALEHNGSLRPLASKFATRTKPVFRVIDGRLQALRRKGRIAFDRKAGWYCTEGAAA